MLLGEYGRVEWDTEGAEVRSHCTKLAARLAELTGAAPIFSMTLGERKAALIALSCWHRRPPGNAITGAHEAKQARRLYIIVSAKPAWGTPTTT